MPKRSSKTPDVNQLAKMIVGMATGEEPPEEEKSDEDDDFDEDDESPWICCRCATDNDETSGMCYSCGHDKCTHCSEF